MKAVHELGKSFDDSMARVRCARCDEHYVWELTCLCSSCEQLICPFCIVHESRAAGRCKPCRASSRALG